MKRIFHLITLLVLVFGLLAATPGSGLAQTTGPTATPLPPATADAGSALLPAGENVFPFSVLGLTDAIMKGPYDSFRVRFSLPVNWELSDGVEVRLALYTNFTSASGLTAAELIQATGATLDVSYNGKVINTVVLDWTGDRTVTIKIPTEALLSAREDGRQDLLLFLDAAIDCNFEHQTTVAVRSTSQFVLPHTLKAPVADLTRLPYPIFQDTSLVPNLATLVVPDQPTASDLQAAFTVAAGFGRLTNGKLSSPVLPAAQVTDEIRKTNHLVFVGKASAFPGLLDQVTGLPAATGAAPDDGIIQMAVSPWDSAHMVLVVGGSSDAGLIKAAQALSSGSLRAGGTPGLALVSDVKTAVETPNVPNDRTFADLGYVAPVVMSGIGLRSEDFIFFLPPGKTSGNDAYFDLVFNHSSTLDYGRSGINVLLNGLSVGSVRLSDATTKTTTSRISLPAYALHSGSNVLTIEANHVPYDYCTNITLNNLWTAIAPTSLVHVPLMDAAANLTPAAGLVTYPYPFISDPNLATMAIVVPANDPTAWNVAGKLAASLGQFTRGSLVTLTTVFGDAVPDAVKQNMDLLVVGRPSALPIVSELGDAMPAPFEAGKDTATEKGFQVTYRIPEGSSLGYVEWLTAPYNGGRTILGVLGSSADGLVWAGNALTDGKLRSKLGGNFAVISGQQVLTSDTRMSVGSLQATVVPETTAVAATPVPVAAGAVANNSWVLPVLIVSSALIILILVILVINSLRKKQG